MGSGTLKDRFEDIFSTRGGKTALVFLRGGRVETELTYREPEQHANGCKAALLETGVAKGDRVVLFVNKSVFFVIAHLAIMKIGAIAVPLNPGFKKTEMEYLLHDVDPKLVIADPDKGDMVTRIVPHCPIISVDTRKPYGETDAFKKLEADPKEMDVTPEDPGLIIYTSGTTGHPKGAVLTHRNLVCDAQNIIGIWEIVPSDVLCHGLPLFHVHGLCFALHTALLAGAGVVMLDSFNPETVAAVLAGKNRKKICSLFMAVPAMYAKLMDALEVKQLNFDHIRLWTSGSAPLPVQDFQRMTRLFGKQPVEREGMSETGMNFSNPLHGQRKPGSIGLPLPGVQVRIVDPDTFDDVPRGRIGEIWLKSAAITPGYWRKPQETSKTFEQGWFRTGDLGKIDADGYYYLTDRIKHIIITGGENVSAKEVENVINSVEGVAESSVVGLPDDKWGEKVVAAVVAKPGHMLSTDDLKRICKKELHDWKCPKLVILVDEIPKNTMGKVLKVDVKGMFNKDRQCPGTLDG
jgi:malonyl-CoA/methylmalonyl-CoA synthetase